MIDGRWRPDAAQTVKTLFVSAQIQLFGKTEASNVAGVVVIVIPII